MTTTVQDAVNTSVLLHLTLNRQSRKDLALALGVTPGAISHRLSGLTRWSLDDLEKLAAHFGVSPADLLNPPLAAFGGRWESVNGREHTTEQGSYELAGAAA